MKDRINYHLAKATIHYKGMWERFYQFGERTTREEFWYAYFAHATISIVFKWLASAIGFGYLFSFYWFVSFVPFTALHVSDLLPGNINKKQTIMLRTSINH